MLQHVICKALSLVAQVIQLGQRDLLVLLIAVLFVQAQQTVTHGAGVDRPDGQTQADVLIHAGLDHFDVLIVAGHAGNLAHAIVRHAAGPIPHHVHTHGLLSNCIHSSHHAGLVKNNIRHNKQPPDDFFCLHYTTSGPKRKGNSHLFLCNIAQNQSNPCIKKRSLHPCADCVIG